LTITKNNTVDRPDIAERLEAALLSLEYDGDSDTGYMAWTAGREVDDQLDWNWLEGRSFQGQRRCFELMRLTDSVTSDSFTILSLVVGL